MRQRKNIFLIIFTIVVLFSAKSVFAASITYSPESKNIAVDSRFTVTVYLSSTDKSVNAFSGTLVFPTDTLSAESVSTDGSIVNFWTLQPAIGTGAVKFEGLVLNPGYKGSSGKLFSVSFLAKSRGVAYISLTGASTLANDGLGTNIFNGVIPKTTVTIGEGVPISTTPVTTSGVPLPPIVVSSTHPDPSDWYSKNTAVLSWELPVGVTDVNYSLDKNPTSTPPQLSKGLVTSYTVEQLSEGESYFHIRFKNSSGLGSVAHFRIGIDTVPPSAVTIEPITGVTDGTLHAKISSSDITSGIEKYEISIDGKDPVYWTPKINEDEFVSGVLSSGRHLIFVRALDFADNSSANGLYSQIEAVPPPVITDYPQNIENGESIKLSGTALPNSEVYIYFEKVNIKFLEKIFHHFRIVRETESEKVKVDNAGDFTFAHSVPWHNGNYHITAKTVLSNGAESIASNFVEVSVLPGKFEKAMQTVRNILLPVIPVLLAIIVIGALSVFLKKSFKKYRKVLMSEADEASVATSESIKIIDNEVMDEISLLKKIRQGEPLSEHEQKFL